MTSATLTFLLKRLQSAESRWDRAMARPGYRDDPNDRAEIQELGGWGETEWLRYGWADAWRLLVHKYENALDRLPEAARARATSGGYRSEPTVYVAEMDSVTLEQTTRVLRTGDRGGDRAGAKPRRKDKAG